MGKYIVKRLLLMIPTLLGVAVLIFFLMRVVPGDIVELRFAGESAFASKENLDKERVRLGLDQPIWRQFLTWIAGIVRLDFGKSMWTGAPILEEIRLRFALSLQLAIMSTLIAVLLAIPLGVIAALKQDRWLDCFGGCVSIAGLVTPSFWLGIVFILGLLIVFKWLPPMVYTPLWVDPWQNLLQLIWPALAVGYRYSAVATRMTRSAMLEVLREDYIRTARAKGLWDKLILSRHALKNAMLPVLTVIALEFAFLMGGLVVTEQVFNLNGLGLLFLEAADHADYPGTAALGGPVARPRCLRPRRPLAHHLRLAHRHAGRLGVRVPWRDPGRGDRRHERLLRRPGGPADPAGHGHLPRVPADHPGPRRRLHPRHGHRQPDRGDHDPDDPPRGTRRALERARHPGNAVRRRGARRRLQPPANHSPSHAAERDGPVPDHAHRVPRAGNPPRGVALLSRPRGGGADARVGAHAARSRRPVRRVGAVDGDLPRVRDQSRGLRVQPLRRLAARRARPTPAHAIAGGPARAYGPPRLSGAAPRLAPPNA